MKSRNIPYCLVISLFTLWLFLFQSGYAQERGLIQSRYFSPKDYKAGTQNWAIAHDHRGVLYFANTSGILEFDGNSWRLIKMPNRSTVRSLAFDGSHTIYAGAYGELGYLKPNAVGNLQYQSLMNLVDKQFADFKEVWDTHCFSDTVFFLSDNHLFRYCNGKFDYWSSKNKSFYLSFKVKNQLYVHELGVGLHVLKNDSLVLIDNGSFFANKRVHSVFSTDKGFLVCTRAHGLFFYDSSHPFVKIKRLSEVSKKAKVVNDYFIKNSCYHATEVNNNLIAIAPISGPILIINRDFEIVEVIGPETVGLKSQALFLHYQPDHSLWMGLDLGICQVEVASPFRYWDNRLGIDGVLTDVATIRDTLYISTTTGVFYTPCQSKNPYDVNRFSTVDSSIEQAWEFHYFDPVVSLYGQKRRERPYVYLPNPQSLLLVASSSGLFQIKGGNATQISAHEGVIEIYQHPNEPSKIFLGLSDGLALISYNNGVWKDYGKFVGINEKVSGIDIDFDGNLWLSATYKGYYRISNLYTNKPQEAKVELFDTNHGLKSLSSLGIFNYKGKIIFYSGDTSYTFNEQTKQFKIFEFPKNADSTKYPIDHIYSSPLWNRVRSDMNTYEFVSYVGDTILWFGSNTGIFKFGGRVNRDYSKVPPTLIRMIHFGDSILFNGADSTNFSISGQNEAKRNIIDLGSKLPYKSKSLVFYFSLPFSEGDLLNQFSFQLVGFDKEWSEWSTETRKEYTILPPGKYIFTVKGRNIYQTESLPAEFHFTILPAWYNSPFIYIFYVFIAGLFVLLIVKLYTKRLSNEKQTLERIVRERTKEIEAQKEELTTQAERIRGAYDWIRAKNIELEYQKKAFEKKKDQLEISNATKNKFFRIISHDLRSPISSLVGSTGLILSEIDSFEKDRLKKVIEDLNKLSLTIYNLLENLLDWSSTQMGDISFKPKPVELVSAIKENVELVSSKLQTKQINLILQVPEKFEVFADENMLQAIIRNLITNAVKFTNHKGRIEISVKHDNSYCYLSVSDNGVGISSENIEKLFRIEKHLSTKGTNNETGSGLGLILCKEFVERNGGEIRVESLEGKGSTFTVKLPLI